MRCDFGHAELGVSVEEEVCILYVPITFTVGCLMKVKYVAIQPLRKSYLVEYILRGPQGDTQRIFALVVEVLGFFHDSFYALRPICGFVQIHLLCC